MNKSNKLVYLIDDDDTIIKIVSMRLDNLGYDYRTFNAPEDFLAAIKERQPDLCLIDLHMGVRKVGLLLIQALRKAYGEKLPLVVLSGDSDNSTIADAIALGADSYMLKPVRRDTFDEVLKGFLSEEEKPQYHLHTVPAEKRPTTLSLEIDAHAIDKEGVTFISNALIVKGTRLRISGKLQEWFGARNPVKVQIVQNWLIPDSNQFGLYAIFEEPSEEVQDKILRALDDHH